MVTTIATQVLASTVLQLPWRAREAIYEALRDRLGATETMMRAASRAGISASDRRGTIQSAANDRAVLPTYARTGDWAGRTHDALAEFFSEAGGTYIDIGANIGLTTPPVARNPLVNCFAFEPEPTNVANLQANVRRNASHRNVVLHRLALLDRAGSVLFGLSDDGNRGDHRVVTGSGGGRRTIEVAAAPLDAPDVPITGRLAIKVDTQGAEPAVISDGMRSFEGKPHQLGILPLRDRPTPRRPGCSVSLFGRLRPGRIDERRKRRRLELQFRCCSLQRRCGSSMKTAAAIRMRILTFTPIAKSVRRMLGLSNGRIR